MNAPASRTATRTSLPAATPSTCPARSAGSAPRRTQGASDVARSPSRRPDRLIRLLPSTSTETGMVASAAPRTLARSPRGDALVQIPGVAAPAGGASSVVGVALINAVVVETAAKLHERGVRPPLIPTMNLPGGDEEMASLVDQWGDRLPLLHRA